MTTIDQKTGYYESSAICSKCGSVCGVVDYIADRYWLCRIAESGSEQLSLCAPDGRCDRCHERIPRRDGGEQRPFDLEGPPVEAGGAPARVTVTVPIVRCRGCGNVALDPHIRVGTLDDCWEHALREIRALPTYGPLAHDVPEARWLMWLTGAGSIVIAIGMGLFAQHARG